MTQSDCYRTITGETLADLDAQLGPLESVRDARRIDGVLTGRVLTREGFRFLYGTKDADR